MSLLHLSFTVKPQRGLAGAGRSMLTQDREEQNEADGIEQSRPARSCLAREAPSPIGHLLHCTQTGDSGGAELVPVTID